MSTPVLRTLSPKTPAQIVIVGAGAAGAAAALTFRQEGYPGRITMIGAEAVEPYDRPNLSKDYLAGNAPEDWLPLKPREDWERLQIRMELGSPVTRLDPKLKTLSLENGRSFNFDALLLATGASPVRLDLPGADQPHVHYLRSLTDCRAIIASIGSARNAVVIGASFIGLEVAASLRARDIAVRVVAPDSRPLERVFGPELGGHIQKLHEDKGVIFHLGRTTASIAEKAVTLDDGSVHPADVVVIGVGVRPATALAERAGLVINQGVQVDQFLETSLPGVFAAGDIARWPDPHTRGHIRVEHWVVAERQGQTAARNILGARSRSTRCPSSGASTTTRRSTTWATQSAGTGSSDTTDCRRVDGRSATWRAEFHSRWPRSAEIGRVSRRSIAWSTSEPSGKRHRRGEPPSPRRNRSREPSH